MKKKFNMIARLKKIYKKNIKIEMEERFLMKLFYCFKKFPLEFKQLYKDISSNCDRISLADALSVDSFTSILQIKI